MMMDTMNTMMDDNMKYPKRDSVYSARSLISASIVVFSEIL